MNIKLSTVSRKISLSAIMVSIAAVGWFLYQQSSGLEAGEPASGGDVQMAYAPQSVQKLLESPGDRIVRKFKVAKEITGWVLSKQGKDLIAYTVAPENMLVIGSLFDDNTKDLTIQYFRKYTKVFDEPVVRSDSPNTAEDKAVDRQALYEQLTGLNSIQKPGVSQQVGPPTDGVMRPEIYVMVDPRCPYCHLLWEVTHGAVDRGELIVHWVPVAILGDESWRQGAQIVSAQRPYDALASAMQGQRSTTPADSLTNQEQTASKQLQRSNELMLRFGFQGTPAIIWRDRQGSVQLAQGITSIRRLESMFNVKLGPFSSGTNEKITSLLGTELGSP